MARKLHLLAVLAVLSLLVAGCDWQMDHFGPGRTSANTIDTTINPANVGKLTQEWTAALGGNGTDPVVAGGRVFVSTNDGLNSTTGSVDSSLDAFDASGTTNCMPSPTSADPKTCTPEWSVPFDVTLQPPALVGGDFLSAPAASDTNSLVYVGVDGPSPCNGRLLAPNFFGDGSTFAYDVATGAPASGFGAEGGGSPALASNSLYTVVTGCFHQSGIFADTSRLAVLNSTTGALEFEAGDPNAIAVDGDPAVSGKSMYAAFGNTLETFDATGSTNCGAPPVSGVENSPFCLPIWTADAGGTIEGSPVVANGTVYVVAATSATSGSLLAFPATGCGAATCSPSWTAPFGHPVTSAPAVTADQVIVGSSDGTVTAFPAAGCGGATCAPVWRGTVGGAINKTPSVAGNLVFVGSANGTLSAFSTDGCGQVTTTCAPLWSTNVGAAITTAPAVANGQVFVVDSNGTLHAYGLTPI